MGNTGKSIAEQIAAQFDDDGQSFENTAGEQIVLVCEDHAIAEGWARRSPDGESYIEVAKSEMFWGDATRYEFSDGSAIVTAGDGWDIEGSQPFTWKGAE